MSEDQDVEDYRKHKCVKCGYEAFDWNPLSRDKTCCMCGGKMENM